MNLRFPPALRFRDYRIFWLGLFVSVIGFAIGKGKSSANKVQYAGVERADKFAISRVMTQ